jgi:hypothetical protein
MDVDSHRIESARRARLVIGSVVTSGLCIIAFWVFFPITKVATHTIHETGHALACVLQGGFVADWYALLQLDGMTDCKPSSNIVTTIGGPALQLAVWIFATLAFYRHAARSSTANITVLLLVTAWLPWSVWNIMQPISWTQHLTPTATHAGRIEWDPARFIRLTHVNPAVLVGFSWIVFVLLFAIGAACVIRLWRPTWAALKQCILEIALGHKRTGWP